MAAEYHWKTVAFAPAERGWELRHLGDGPDEASITAPIVGWLTQEQVDTNGQLTGVAAVRVIAGYLRQFSDAAPAAAQESDEGFMAAEVVSADEPGWHVHWSG